MGVFHAFQIVQRYQIAQASQISDQGSFNCNKTKNNKKLIWIYFTDHLWIINHY